MCPFPFSPDVTDAAMENAREHVRKYFSTDIYDEQAFMGRCQIDLENVRELTREQLMDRGTDGVLNSGIYLIVAENGLSAYVGLANEFYSRFCLGRTAHTAQCPQNCGHYGHFANPTEGSSRVGMPDGNCRFFIVENIEHQEFGISQAEIDWYYLFRANGWIERSAVGGEQRITNHRPSLGVKGREAQPCIVLDVESGNHMFFVGQQNAAENLGIRQADLNNTIYHRQNQNGGYTARNASMEEAQDATVRGERGVIWRDGEDGDIIHDMRDSCRGCANPSERHSRVPRMTWTSGELSELDINHLRGTRRLANDGAGYAESNPESDYIGLRWHKRGGWQCGVKIGPRGKDILQRGPHKSWGTAEGPAALYRELWILREDLTEFNRGENGSNANLLNRRLTSEQRDGQVFVDWERM